MNEDDRFGKVDEDGLGAVDTSPAATRRLIRLCAAGVVAV
jgi:hypothetical protein